MQAYVLVQNQSREGGTAKDLRMVPGVVLAEDLTGPYDAIAFARSDSSEGPLEGVIARIRELPGVIRTISAPLIDSSREFQDGEAA